MQILPVIAVACGGALGALARFALTTVAQAVIATKFPIGTLLVNCIGGFLIGLLMYFFINRVADSAEIGRLFVVVGFLGAFTTFSSYGWETMVLFEDGLWVNALLNVLLNNGVTLILVVLGFNTGRTLFNA